jgi:hypothetical protein
MEEHIYEEGMVVQVVGENKFVHQKKSIMMAKTVNTQSKTTLKHAGIIPSNISGQLLLDFVVRD